MTDKGPSDDYEARRRARGVVREVTAEEFAELVEDAQPRTPDDQPWKFPRKLRMWRSRRTK